MTGNIRLGLIGAGPWGRNYISTLGSLDGVTLSRLASSNPDSAALVPAGCVISRQWQDVAQARDLDGVIIAAPPHVHGEMTRAALKAGLAVLVEKPLTLDATEAQDLLSLAETCGGLVVVNHIHLFSPAWKALKDAAQSLGRPLAIRAAAGRWGPFRSQVPVLWDWGPHDISMCLDLIGQAPVSFSVRRTQTRQMPGGAGESLDLVLEFSGPVLASLKISNLMTEKQRLFSVDFENQTLVYDDMAPDKLMRHAFPGGPGQAVAIAPGLPLTQAVIEFATRIRDGSGDLASLRLGVEAVVILDKLAQTR